MGRGREAKRREEKKREYQRRESQKKEYPCAGKGRKSRHTVFFQWMVAPESRSVGTLKRWVRPCGVPNQNVFKNATCSNHFLKLRCWKNARHFGANYTLTKSANSMVPPTNYSDQIAKEKDGGLHLYQVTPMHSSWIIVLKKNMLTIEMLKTQPKKLQWNYKWFL